MRGTSNIVARWSRIDPSRGVGRDNPQNASDFIQSFGQAGAPMALSAWPLLAVAIILSPIKRIS